MKSTFKIILLNLILVLTSCSVLKPIKVLDKHQAKVILKNKKILNGKVTIKHKKIKINNQKFVAEEVEKIIIYNNKKTTNQYELNFEKIKSLFGRKNYWIIKTGTGKYVNSYIGAEGYLINDTGDLILRGSSQYISSTRGGGHMQSPTFPILMKKKEDIVLKAVGLDGRQYEKN